MSVIYTAPHSPEWFAARRGGITGTDLPKILGLSKYGNALSVWLDKRGELPADEAGEAALWGTLLEDTVCAEWARREDVKVDETGVWLSEVAPWMRASPDRIVTGCPADTSGRGCYLEAKTRHAMAAGQWRSDVPDDVLAQVAWASMVLDVDHAHVAVLLGGQRLESHRYDRDPVLEDYLRVEASQVWAHVTAGTRPDVAADGEGVLLAVLNREAGPRAGEVEVDDPDWVSYQLRCYAEAGQAAKDADAAKKVAVTELVRVLGEGPGAAHTALVDGVAVFTYKAPAAGVTFGAAALKRLAKVDRETYERLREGGFITSTDPAPRFAVKATSVEEQS